MKKSFLFVLSLIIGLSFATTAQNSITNSFFDQVNYVGAFGTTDWTSGWANFNPQTTVYPAATVVVPNGNLTSSQTWTSGNTYLLNGWVRVPNGIILTIEPGVIIRGDYANQGALIIERGGKLMAEGTSSNPIVFTSNQAPGSRNYGDWGGLIVLGHGVINTTGGTAIIEGGVNSTYGGTNDADNSGVLKYVRIEFPGIAFSPNNEINGLTMGGVGSGTTLDYIQVSYSGDDSFEWFGGSVNAKHLIAYRGWDDDFDTDNGYKGMVQFAVSLRDPAIADVSSSNSFESDNDATGSSNSPLTSAIFSNVSIFGPAATSSTTFNSLYARSMHLRRNTSISIFNSIFAGWKDGLRIEGSAAQANATANNLRIENTILAGMTGVEFYAAFDNTYFMNASRNNDTLSTTAQLMITDPFNLTNPNFLPLTGSPVYNSSYWGTSYSVSGTVNYDNTANTLLSNCTVKLMSGTTALYTTTSDANGAFSFGFVPAGNYTLQVSTTRPWSGVNILDVVIARKYAATLQTLSAFKQLAGDVTGDNVLNILDALMIQRKIATLSTPAWTAGNWVFEKPSISVTNSNITISVKGAVAGDLHGIATPPSN